MPKPGFDTGLPARRAALEMLRSTLMDKRLLSHQPAPGGLDPEDAKLAVIHVVKELMLREFVFLIRE